MTLDLYGDKGREQAGGPLRRQDQRPGGCPTSNAGPRSATPSSRCSPSRRKPNRSRWPPPLRLPGVGCAWDVLLRIQTIADSVREDEALKAAPLRAAAPRSRPCYGPSRTSLLDERSLPPDARLVTEGRAVLQSTGGAALAGIFLPADQLMMLQWRTPSAGWSMRRRGPDAETARRDVTRVRRTAGEAPARRSSRPHRDSRRRGFPLQVAWPRRGLRLDLGSVRRR